MCQFFSFVGDGFGNYKYLDWEYRKDHLNENCDSHTFILTHFKIPPKNQDRFSKYEYNPLTKQFTIDEPVEGHDHEAAENWANNLNFKTIIPQLIIKPIINPFSLDIAKISNEDIILLKQWDSVWASIQASVWDSVWASVWASIQASVWASVWDSVRVSVWDSVRVSVGDSVWDSVRVSVGDSVRAYISSFFNINYKYDFSSVNELWNKGIVPSFNGKTWRLHSGKDATIIYKWNKNESNT